MTHSIIIGKKIFEKALSSVDFLLSSPKLKAFIPQREGVFFIEDGEKGKSREEKEKIENWLLEMRCDKSSTLIGVGGGAVLDVVGFVAATFYRGIPYISVPTTLLAMTDAAIGGKVAINVGGAKNVLGAFYPPKAVYVDIDFLESLPKIEFLNGMAEVIKHSLIASPPFFSFLKSHWQAILDKDEATLLEMLKKSIGVKEEIVKEDPLDLGKRRLLNFGHTIGHALEAGSQYLIPHGEAVRRGMIGESYLSMKMGIMKKETFEEIYQMLNRFSIPFSFDFNLVRQALIFDKKNLKGKNRFVILQEIGKPLSFSEEYVTPVSEELIDEALLFTLRHS